MATVRRHYLEPGLEDIVSAPGLTTREELSLKQDECFRQLKALELAREGLLEAKAAGFEKADEILVEMDNTLSDWPAGSRPMTLGRIVAFLKSLRT